jgi:hypothetical protein
VKPNSSHRPDHATHFHFIEYNQTFTCTLSIYFRIYKIGTAGMRILRHRIALADQNLAQTDDFRVSPGSVRKFHLSLLFFSFRLGKKGYQCGHSLIRNQCRALCFFLHVVFAFISRIRNDLQRESFRNNTTTKSPILIPIPPTAL